ncbi:MAG: alginate lyase family protein [Paenibacillaceae bacterium]
MEKSPDTFALYRIVGNDLYPRHKKGQTCENLKFILEHEPELENCEKKWIVNRIIDKEEELAIITQLHHHEQPFIHIPFHEEAYKVIEWDMNCLPDPGYLVSKEFENLDSEVRIRFIAAMYQLKNNYVMNTNGARNKALRDGRSRVKWILPWDGNCFVTRAAWKQIHIDVTASPHLKYFTVPMTRVVNNKQLLADEFTPRPVEEPQLIFRDDSIEEFYEKFCYGRRSKVELFWRLAIPGEWDCWKDDPWDQPRRPKSSEAGQFGAAGWTARLFSGMKKLEQDNKASFKQRGLARLEGIISTLRHVDVMIAGKSADSNTLSMYREDVLKGEERNYRSGKHLPHIDQLIADAKEAITRAPYSVTDKKSLPPSDNIHDYWHPAPYWWPNPNTKDGLPYIRRDGKRVPGTHIYEKKSDKYDRSRLQRVFDDSIILAMAWKFTGDKTYAKHGARILERFFIHPDSRMSPHLIYAQVRMGRNRNEGSGTGIIEMKDLYYYLDAIRLLKSAGVIKEDSFTKFKDWLSTYLTWLVQSPQGKKERMAVNNHGTYYDLQVASIADFLDNHPLLFETFIRAQSRIALQFAVDGSQPEELKRATSAHYCCFNFQGWVNMAEIASKWGIQLWSYRAPNGASLIKGAKWLLSYAGKEWPHKQIEEFDVERFLPIWFAVPQHLIKLPKSAKFPKSKYTVKPRFFPHDGVRPYWNLGLSRRDYH